MIETEPRHSRCCRHVSRQPRVPREKFRGLNKYQYYFETELTARGGGVNSSQGWTPPKKKREGVKEYEGGRGVHTPMEGGGGGFILPEYGEGGEGRFILPEY